MAGSTINIPQMTWRDPVSTSSDLPAFGNNAGDCRVVLDTSTIYTWTGTMWIAAEEGILIGAPIHGGSPNDILFVDPDSNVGQDDRFTVQDARLLMERGIFVGSTDPDDYETDPTAAAATIQTLYMQAVTPGAAGNSLTIELVSDVTAGDEYAEVTGGVNIILHIEGGVTTDFTGSAVLNAEPTVTALATELGILIDGSALVAGGPTTFSGGHDAMVADDQVIVKTKVIIGDLQTVPAPYPTNFSYDAAILEIASTTQGVLLPRMTFTQRDDIVDPTAGLMVWVTANGDNYLSVYGNGGWQRIPEYGDVLLDGGNFTGADVVFGTTENGKKARVITDQDKYFTFSEDSGTHVFSSGNFPGDGDTNLRITASNADGGHGWVTLKGADSAAASGSGGRLVFNGGDGGVTDGDGGDIINTCGDVLGATGVGGGFQVLSGDGVSQGGGLDFSAGNGSNGRGGDSNFTSGNGTGGSGGWMAFYVGNGDTAEHFYATSGNASTSGRGGDFRFGTGTGPDGNGVIRFGVGPDASAVNEDIHQARVSTTDATVTAMTAIEIPTDKSVELKFTIEGHRTGGAAGATGDSATYIIRGRAKNIAGTVTLHDVVAEQSETQAGWDADLFVASTTVEPRVTGAVDNNIDWNYAAEVVGRLE